MQAPKKDDYRNKGDGTLVLETEEGAKVRE
jgi:hypothetical protein